MSKKQDNRGKTDPEFRDRLGGVRPITARRQHLQPPKPKPHAKFSQQDEQAALEESLQDDPDSALIECGDELLFHRPKVNRLTLRQLRRGKFAVQDEIDLHGLTAAQAKPELRGFIQQSCRSGFRCIRVVHGKGLGSGPRGPVLKSLVNHWLSRWDEIAAFCSARPQDGGTGAVYVLLSK